MQLIRTTNIKDTEHYSLVQQYHTHHKTYNITLWVRTHLKRDILLKTYSTISKKESDDVFAKWCMYIDKEEERYAKK